MKTPVLSKTSQRCVALTLRQNYELSYAFIAEIVGTSASSVKRWFNADPTENTSQATRIGKYKKGNDLVKDKQIRSLVEKYEDFCGEPIEEHGMLFVGCMIPSTFDNEVLCDFLPNGDAILVELDTDARTFKFKKMKATYAPSKKSDYVTVETKNSITIVEKGKQRTVSKENPAFKAVQKMLKKGRVADAHATMAKTNLKSVAHFTEGRVSITDDGVLFDGIKIESALAKKNQSSFEAGDDVCRSLSMFLERIKNNPDQRVVNSIYEFISKHDIKIDSEGFIIAFKVVRENYLDKHSGTMDNAPGNLVDMNRSSVDSNPSQTCSRGLHLCSLAYVPHFGNTTGGDRLVKCLVDPADFVAIPADYNAAKARVCEYFVLEDITDAYNKGLVRTHEKVEE